MSDEKLPQGVTTAPKRIWLQVGTDDWHLHEPFPEYGENVSWCWESCTDAEVEYVRADLAAPAEPTDEMVDAAWDSLIESDTMCEFPSREQVRAALRAALGVRES
jgi:hypothetical protein